MGKSVKRIGDIIETQADQAFARGGDVLQGEVRMLDLAASDAAVTGVDPRKETSVWGNVVPITAAGALALFPIVSCRDPDGIKDDQSGYWVCEGIADVAVVDDDVAGVGSEVRVGLMLTVSAGNGYLSKAVSGDRVVAVAVEDAAATSADTDHTVDASSHKRTVLFFGGKTAGVFMP